jgi:ribokinase
LFYGVTSAILRQMTKRPEIVVVGSSNTDLVIFCDRLPKPGETVLGGDFQTFGGGKGANQAVAAARAGGSVSFVGAYGADDFGSAARERLSKEQINTEFFQCTTGAPSGVALILIDGVSRENLIAVARSANDLVDSAMVLAARTALDHADMVIAQLEIRDGAIEATARLCQELHKTFVLNPAPSRQLPRAILERVSVIVVNEHEARDLTGKEAIDQAIEHLHSEGCRQVVVTLGAEGARLSQGERIVTVAAPTIQPVDTTGAGDCFVGWLGVGLAEGLNLEQAARRACRAASLAATRPGAQSGMPTREEVLVFEKSF